jgi:hypothetical protein
MMRRAHLDVGAPASKVHQWEDVLRVNADRLTERGDAAAAPHILVILILHTATHFNCPVCNENCDVAKFNLYGGDSLPLQREPRLVG